MPQAATIELFICTEGVGWGGGGRPGGEGAFCCGAQKLTRVCCSASATWTPQHKQTPLRPPSPARQQAKNERNKYKMRQQSEKAAGARLVSRLLLAAQHDAQLACAVQHLAAWVWVVCMCV